MAEPRWVELAALDDIPEDRPKTVKIDGHQLAVIRDGERVYAIDNRCPHEGYPLATGQVSGNVLTCEWHNWKFELGCPSEGGGRCILGGEDVRAYPIRRAGDQLLIDLAPLADQTDKLLGSLTDALEDADWGWVARVLERLLGAGMKSLAIAERVAIDASERSPYGFDHGLATTADLTALLDGSDADGERLLEACHAMVMPNLRRPAIPQIEPAGEPASEALLRAAIEAEEVARSEALVRRALVDHPVDVVAGWLSRAASDHFVGYGHGEIYAVKAAELCDRFGPGEGSAALLVAMSRTLALGTREDRLPYMRRFAALLEPRRAKLADRAAGAGDGALEPDALIAAVLDGDLESALAAVDAALDRGCAPERIGLALGLAAAHRLARFDGRLEDELEVGHGWLDITHLVTHADAVVEACKRWPSADALRGLYHSARFVQHAAPLDHPEPPELEPPPDAAGLWREAFAGGVAPIFFAHRIKMTAAALRLTAGFADDPGLGERADRDLPLRATARYLRAPIAERRNAGRAVAARRFVHQGQRLVSRLGY